jgi:hypothetical protein
MRLRYFSLALLLLSTLAARPALAQAPAQLRAGAAKSDISRVEAGLRINDPVYAKALVLAQGDTKVAIIAMDVTAIGGIGEVTDAFLPELRARLEAELGIPPLHVLVNASHNHPPLNFLCSHEEQVARAFDAVKRAHDALEPVTAGAGSGEEKRISMNRTLRLKDGTGWTIRHSNPSPPDDVVESVGPVDPEIGVLRLDRADGSTLAVLYNFACHPYVTVPEGGVTSDYPGFASEVIEDNLPGAMAIFIQGAGGDITPILYKDVNRARDSAPEGRILGLSTLKAVRTVETKPANLKVVNEALPLPRKADFEERIAAFKEEEAQLLASLRGMSLNFKTFVPLYMKHLMDPEHPLDYSYRYLQSASIGENEFGMIDQQNRDYLAKYMKNIRTMEELTRIQDDIATLRRHQKINADSGETTVATEVMGLRIGDFVLVSSPTEMLTTVGLNVKGASPFEHTFISAYSNGYIHYGPPASEYAMGGYEAVECLLAPEWQALYEAKAAEVLKALE